jgi:hypothetical protein
VNEKNGVPFWKAMVSMSNKEMLWEISSVGLLFLSCLLWGQSSHSTRAEDNDIERVKALLVSSLDSSLPRVTLEFFLNYEGGGIPIAWGVRNCDQGKVNGRPDGKRKSIPCVEADLALKDGRHAHVAVSIEESKAHPDGGKRVSRVAVTDTNGRTRVLEHLSDLPAELKRPLPKTPRDLPLPVG